MLEVKKHAWLVEHTQSYEKNEFVSWVIIANNAYTCSSSYFCYIIVIVIVGCNKKRKFEKRLFKLGGFFYNSFELSVVATGSKRDR